MLIRVQHKYLVFGRPVKVTEKGTPINFGAEDAYRTTARRSQHATDSYIVFLLFLIVIVVLQPDNNRYKRWLPRFRRRPGYRFLVGFEID